MFCWVLHPNQVSFLGGKNMFWILFGFLLLVLRTRIPVTYLVYGKYYFIPSKESWERLKNLKIFDRINREINRQSGWLILKITSPVVLHQRLPMFPRRASVP